MLYFAKAADVNAKAWNRTLLRWAAEYGHKVVAVLLLGKGADVNAENNGGATPLHIAVYNTHKDMAELLIAKGADMNTAAKDGTTPLQIAKDEGNKEIVELLRKHGAKE
jgi:ankyrin repeat protein